MINEHDIADMMDQAFKEMPEEKKTVSYKTEGEEGIIDFETFLLGYTETLYNIFAATWGIKSKSEWFQEGYEAGVHDSGGKG